MATTVRVEDTTAIVLRELAREEHRSIGQVVEEAVSRYKRDKFWDKVEESVENLRSDPDAWKDYKEEINILEGGSMDGFDDDAERVRSSETW